MKNGKMSLAGIRREIGVTYLGGVSVSAKAVGSQTIGVMTYIMYLAPWDQSGVSVCPWGERCHKSCLAASGLAKVSAMSAQDGKGRDVVKRARINRTKYLLNPKTRPNFMRLLVSEINAARRLAERKGMAFAVRLNGTSDLNPRFFRDADGRNILEIFPDVQFYDYTKSAMRVVTWDKTKYPNYDLTFSYDGGNWAACQGVLAAGGRVAVVFDMEKEQVGDTWQGYPVVDGSSQDARFADPAGVVVYLHYHPVTADYRKINGKRVRIHRKDPFVIRSLRQRPN